MKTIITIVLFIMPFLAGAQLGSDFPVFEVETVKGSKLEIPSSCRGKLTLIGMASSREAEEHLSTWAQPVYDKFISKNKTDIWDENYDINLYFIPLFVGLNQSAMESARKKSVANTDTAWHPYFLFYKGKGDVFKEQLNMVDKTKPYFFILDENGKVVYVTSGSFSQKKMDDIQEFLDR